jgi:phosphatidylglycerol lysyltransferase
VGPDHLYLYVDLGLTLLKLGEEARVPLEDFSLEGSSRKNLRYVANKHDKEGFRFRVIPVQEVPSVIARLKEISDSWLKQKNTREKGFSLGYFDETYLKNFSVGVVEKESQIVAFANIWAGAQKEELSIDLMRYSSDAPRGIMEYLFIKLMLWGKHEGYRWFNLGMSPLSGFQHHPLAPLWNKIGGFIYLHGEDFYNFEGLRTYKEKFDPVWEPCYLASPAGLQFPRIFANVTTLISGGLKGVLAK